jgi:hypothetical protein
MERYEEWPEWCGTVSSLSYGLQTEKREDHMKALCIIIVTLGLSGCESSWPYADTRVVPQKQMAECRATYASHPAQHLWCLFCPTRICRESGDTSGIAGSEF